MEIPDDISKVGIYKHGAAPGSNGGSTILVSHRDGVGSDPGAFYNLETLQMGDKVDISYINYTSHYIIIDRFMTKKDSFYKKAPKLFRYKGPPQLVMITCGGGFDFEAGSYKKNVIVIAIPLTYSHTNIYNGKHTTLIFN
jgi:sortase (surface protein transpeptidase)